MDKELIEILEDIKFYACPSSLSLKDNPECSIVTDNNCEECWEKAIKSITEKELIGKLEERKKYFEGE